MDYLAYTLLPNFPLLYVGIIAGAIIIAAIVLYLLADRIEKRSVDLSIDKKLLDQPLKLTASNGWDGKAFTNQEVFDSHIWSLKVMNRSLKAGVTACTARIYFDFIGEEVPFTWRPVQGEQDEISIGTDPRKSLREQYVEALGYRYGNEVLNGSFETAIPSSVNKQIYFLFTFKDSQYAYLILPIGEEGKGSHFLESSSISMGRQIFGHSNYLFATVNEIPLRISYGRKEVFKVRFEGDGYSEKLSRAYELRLHSYDNIELVKLS